MTVRAKTLIKDKFWIVEEHGQKLGTLQKKDDNGWIFLSKKDHRQVFHTQESLFTKFGFNIFEEKTKEPIIEELDQTVAQAKAENKSIDQVGIRFMRFCAKYDLNRISEQAQLYVEPFNARLAS